MEPITEFKNGFRWLSNFYLAEVEFEGKRYASSEHAYQAAKTLDLKKREELQMGFGLELAHNPGKAKHWGRRVAMRPDWDDVRVSVMKTILRDKFTRHPDLRQKLLETGDRELVEGNTWGDRFWGVCNGVGENNLGKVLMEIRVELWLMIDGILHEDR